MRDEVTGHEVEHGTGHHPPADQVGDPILDPAAAGLGGAALGAAAGAVAGPVGAVIGAVAGAVVGAAAGAAADAVTHPHEGDAAEGIELTRRDAPAAGESLKVGLGVGEERDPV